MAETAEVSRESELRELLEIAAERRARSLLGTISRLGVGQPAGPSDVELYDMQLRQFPIPSTFLERITGMGTWQVSLRPVPFDPLRVATLGECWRLVQAAQVSLRGWSFPYLEAYGPRTGGDGVSSEADFMNNIEYWRMFQSGQFNFHQALWEDADPRPPQPFLDFLSAIYTCSEVYEFSARLGAAQVLGREVEIGIGLHGTAGRWLGSSDRGRRLRTSRPCDMPSVEYRRRIAVADLVARPAEGALDVVQFIFERFGWLNPSRELLAEDQRRFLERELS